MTIAQSGWIEAALLLVMTGLLVGRFRDAMALRRYMRRVRDLASDDRDLTLRLGAQIFRDHPVAHDDPVYIHRVLGPLGGSACDILKHGACCSGKARLLIQCMAQVGISAFQVTLYHREGHAQHCLVQVDLPSGPLIVDPLYGISFVGTSGESMGIVDLQQGAAPVHEPLPGTASLGYPRDPYYDFDYRLTKTANWTRSAPRRLAFWALTVVAGQRASRLRVPAALEHPQGILIAALFVGYMLLALTSHSLEAAGLKSQAPGGDGIVTLEAG